MWVAITQRLFLTFVFDIVYFPIWWFTGGIRYFFGVCRELFLSGNSTLMPGLWLKHIFTPMFGQSDFQGRIVSFIVRFFNVLIRGILLLLWLIIISIFFVLWVLIPIAVVFLFFQALI